MRDYLDSDTYSRAGDWFMSTARHNPEALLLLAAGCALLMRGGGSFISRTPARRHNLDGSQRRDWETPSYDATGESVGSRAGAAFSAAREAAGEHVADVKRGVAETASEYGNTVSQYARDARRTAGEYADSVSEFARETGRTISGQSERLRRQASSVQGSIQDGVNRVVRQQPLAVAAAGLAAGAAVAAVFPSTRLENRAFGGAHEALAQAASKTGENLVDAAGEAGERLRATATGRLKDLAGDAVDAVDTFASQVAGSKVTGSKDNQHVEATTVPQPPKASRTVGVSRESGLSTGRSK